MEKNANTIEIREIMKLYRKGILFNFKPYETLITKLSMFAAIPINNIETHCILIAPCPYLFVPYVYEQIENSVRNSLTK